MRHSMVSMANELKVGKQLLIAAEDLAVIDNADVVLLGPLAIDRGRNLVIGHQPDRADPRRVVADRAQAEADLVIVRKATLFVGHALGLGIPARIGKIPLALGAVLSIPPIDPGDHHIGRTLGAHRVGRQWRW